MSELILSFLTRNKRCLSALEKWKFGFWCSGERPTSFPPEHVSRETSLPWKWNLVNSFSVRHILRILVPRIFVPFFRWKIDLPHHRPSSRNSNWKLQFFCFLVSAFSDLRRTSTCGRTNDQTTMRWFKKYSNDSPRLISLSPLRHGDQQDGSILSYYSHRDGTENDCNASLTAMPQTPVTVNKRRTTCASPLATSSSMAASSTLVNVTTHPTTPSSNATVTASDPANIRKSRIGNYTFHFISFDKSNSSIDATTYGRDSEEWAVAKIDSTPLGIFVENQIKRIIWHDWTVAERIVQLNDWT